MSDHYAGGVEPELIDLLRADLIDAEYTLSALTALWGETAERSRQRGVLVPVRRALAERQVTPGVLLARGFLLGDTLTAEELDTALPKLTAQGAERLGLVAAAAGGYLAAMSLNPVQLPDPAPSTTGDVVEWWILSDLDDHLRRGPARHDHVMGVGGATRSLIAQAPLGAAVTRPGHSALDLGTGCGIVALVLAKAQQVQRVVASDISERALMFARANARLNGFDARIDFRLGDLFEAVADETFGLILSNPPFVITPRVEGELARYEYRDGGMTGDALAEKVVREAPGHLAAGGTLVCLANWETPWGGDGLERVREWIGASSEQLGTAVSAWVIERDRVDPAQYAETWARDGGARPGDHEFDALLEAWIDDFARRKIVSIGLGAIRVRREETGAPGDSVIRTESAPGMYTSDQPGRTLAAAFQAGAAAERQTIAELLGIRWVRSERAVEEREHQPGEEAPRAIRLVTDAPIGRRFDADTLLAAALGACDGELTLGQIAGALATILDVDETDAGESLAESIRELAWYGMVVPADQPDYRRIE